MERKTLAIGIVLIVAIAAGTTGAVIFFLQPESEDKVLTVGQMYLPYVIDVHDAWDSASNDVLRQVLETLYVNDYADTALPIIPMLASAMGTWNPAMTEYTVPLREGVTFHDGSAFNADDVIFTFERMAFMFNFTGLNTFVPDVVELYAYPNHTQIVKDVVKNSDYSVTFVLNDKFAPFVDLLTYQASAILPDSGVYTNAYVDLADDFMVGTGPFVYEYFDVGIEVVMTAYDDYWGGRARIDKLVFVGIRNAQARNAALLAGDILYLPDPMDEMWDLFNSTSGITLEQEPLGRSSVTQYLGMNNVLLNRTWREAISYAFDYDYLIDEIRFGHASRLKSPVPPAIKYSNSTFDIPITNYTHARLVMQSMGLGVGFNVSDDAEWIAQATGGSEFRLLNYTYNIGNDVREDVLILLGASLKKIGILVIDAGMSWGDFLNRLYESPPYTRNNLALYFIGWGPDYNDPMNFINPLFTNKTVASNGAQYDGYEAAVEARDDTRWTDSVDPNNLWDNVQLLMEAALMEGNVIVREAMYDRIQELIMTRDFPWVFGYNGVITKAFVSNLEGVIISAMDNDYFYTMYFS